MRGTKGRGEGVTEPRGGAVRTTVMIVVLMMMSLMVAEWWGGAIIGVGGGLMWLSHCARCAARMRAGAIQHKVRCKARKARRIGGRRYSAPHRGRVRHRWKWRAGMLKGKRYRRLRREVRRALRRNGGGVDCVGRVRGGVKGIMRGMAVWVAVWALLLITTPDERYDADEMRRIVGAICVGWVLGNTGRGAMPHMKPK